MVENFGESITTEFGAQSYPTWDNKGTYVQYQRVQHNGLTYGAKKTSIGQEPSKDSEYWELLASLPVKQGEARDTLIFENDDKTQAINGKGITGSSPINVDNGDTVNTVSVDTATKSQLGVVKAGTNINISNGSISVPTATTNQKGVVQVGDGLIVDSGTISVPTGNTEQKGLLQVGDGITVNDGIISAKEYELPTASADTLGGVKVGDGLSIADGVLSASSSGSGWETVESTKSGAYNSMFDVNAYKNDSFILINCYGNSSIPSSGQQMPTGLNAFTVTLPTINNPFVRSTDIPSMLCSYNVSLSSDGYYSWASVKNTTNGFVVAFNSKSGYFYRTTHFSVLIPYLEI